MIQCKACGQENENAAAGCVRCRVALRGEGESSGESGSGFGSVCGRCEAYNEPGVRICTGCGMALFETPATTPVQAPAAVNLTITSELRALSLSDEEAAEAGIPGIPAASVSAQPAPARATAGSPGAPMPRPAPRAASTPPPPPLLDDKACLACGARNPLAANFCFECGTPFGGRNQAPRAAKPSTPVEASLEVAPTTESAPVFLEDPPGERSSGEPWPQPEGGASAEPIAEAAPAEPQDAREWLPFQAKLVVEKGNRPGTAFSLSRKENPIGSSGASVELDDDPFVAPLSATLMFVEDRLAVRDEGSANGIFVKLRSPAQLVPGDHFIAGERLFRFEGPLDLQPAGGEVPLLGSPRPAPPVVRIVEVLAGGGTGRICLRSGPSITLGRSGCDLSFPADALLAARHAEIQLSADGTAVLADLAQAPSGVLLRVRAGEEQAIQGGDLLQVGNQQLRIEIG